MEAEKEDTTNIELFWTLFNEVLQKVSGHKEYKFNPLGWCTDMASDKMPCCLISRTADHNQADETPCCCFFIARCLFMRSGHDWDC